MRAARLTARFTAALVRPCSRFGKRTTSVLAPSNPDRRAYQAAVPDPN